MRIAIDGYEANVPQRLGSSQIAFELLKSLEKIDRINTYTIFLPSPPLSDLPKEREKWRYRLLKPKKMWTRIALPLALYTAKQKPDLFFSPTHYIPRFMPGKIKKIVTIFDLSFLHFPEMFTKSDLWQLKNWTGLSVENADHIVTISNFSKKDIMNRYGIKKDNIAVTYPAYDRENFTSRRGSSFEQKVEEVKKQYKIGGDYVFPKEKGKALQASSKIFNTASEAGSYIIYIGTIQPRKNLLRLIEAFARIVNGQSGNKLELVIAGKAAGEGRQGWMYEDILKAPKELGISEKVKFLGFVPTEDLSLLLSGAVAFIQPSLWEGFGIPVLEAMATGTPVIVSNVSSLPEVVGKAGLLVDPYSIDQIEQAIRLVATDKKLRQKYSKAGILQAKKFSWDKMAKKVLKVFEKELQS